MYTFHLILGGVTFVHVGTSSGDLFVFSLETREVVNSIEKAHAGAVLCMCQGGGAESSCSGLVTGGKDQTVNVWNQALQPVSSFDVSAVSFADGSVGAVDILPSSCSRGKDPSVPGNLTVVV